MIAGLILAAGAGTRFGDQPKLLAELDGRPLLEHAIRAQSAVRALDRIVVVLGAFAEEVRLGGGLLGARPGLGVEFLDAEPVLCADWREGQAASLRCGAEALAGARKVLVTLGDEPLLTPPVIAHFLDEPPGTRASYDGRPGHPVVLGPTELDQIATLTGDRGARGLIRDWRLVECGHLCPSRDVDTVSDLEAIRDEARASV
jgi:CTP:molybdopterin cytidylyltransferase MocA